MCNSEDNSCCPIYGIKSFICTGKALTTISVSIKISKPRIGNRADNEVRLNSLRPRGPIIYSFVGNEVKLWSPDSKFQSLKLH